MDILLYILGTKTSKQYFDTTELDSAIAVNDRLIDTPYNAFLLGISVLGFVSLLSIAVALCSCIRRR